MKTTHLASLRGSAPLVARWPGPGSAAAGAGKQETGRHGGEQGTGQHEESRERWRCRSCAQHRPLVLAWLGLEKERKRGRREMAGG
jgi:hypothetical protein